MKLLIVEDDLLLQEGLALALGNEGYAPIVPPRPLKQMP